jgi:hypothetical protein
MNDLATGVDERGTQCLVDEREVALHGHEGPVNVAVRHTVNAATQFGDVVQQFSALSNQRAKSLGHFVIRHA